jgi:hypothetical protein
MMMKDSKTQFCCSEFPWARERISPKIIENFGMRSQKGSPALVYTNKSHAINETGEAFADRLQQFLRTYTTCIPLPVMH